ncbi:MULTISPECIES: tyrosine-type recombinase/integrase [Roseobacteraceae]|uniref:Tyrosine recombinase XerC n=2 Tax=Roseobacteraceae TaxID=2854170 RepID=A0A221K840_9RHOB|nr:MULTISPECIES: tyrosine-type recombinase/integrase [Roseobacteraceae]ASM75168.1 tyrosine recombinase XerC [Pseudosulfitobacter pseudonitzschiae]
MPRPIDRDILRAVLQASEGPIAARSKSGADDAKPASQNDVTILIVKLLIVTGLRISELTNLKVRDVSQDGSQTLVRGKGNKKRIVFVQNHELQEEFGEMEVSDAKKLKALEAENAKLKKLLAEQMMDVSTLKEMLGKNF